MKRIFVAAAISIAITAAALAQVTGHSSIPGVTAAVADQQQAIGTPVGVPIAIVQQPAPAAGGGVINIGQALGPFLQPYVDALVQAILAVLAGWVLWFCKNRLGINIDEANRRALQDAISRQASSLVADGFVKVEQNGKVAVPNNPALVDAANKALAAVPGAMKYFGLDANPNDVAARIVDALPHVPAVAAAQAGAITPTAEPPKPAPTAG